MNATQVRLSAMTVKGLREVARQIGIKGLSGARKAELVNALTVWIDGCHADALITDSLYVPTRKMAAALDTLVKASEIIVPATPVMGPMVNEYGFTAHGDTYAVDYNRVHVAMNVKAPITIGMPVADSAGNVGEISYAYPDDEVINVTIAGRCFRVSTNKAYAMIARAKEQAETVQTFDTATGEFRESTTEEIATVTALIDSDSNPINDVVRFANEAIAALMPNLTATKLAFETLRDNEASNPNHVDLAYQVYIDTHRAIEEYRRTIAYATDTEVHTCATWEREIGLSGCDYGCKIYRCDKCQSTREVHNPIYGCRKGL